MQVVPPAHPSNSDSILRAIKDLLELMSTGPRSEAPVPGDSTLGFTLEVSATNSPVRVEPPGGVNANRGYLKN